MIKKYLKINNIIDIMLIFSIFILALKKGGFYISDSFEFNIFVSFIGIFSICYNLARKIVNDIYKKCDKEKSINKNEIKNDKNVDVINILLFLLPVFYILPIILKNYTNLKESIFEAVRYLDLFFIYNIVKNSENKKIYEISIIILSFILCLFGFDGLAQEKMAGVLKKINSGYLSLNNLNRMSSTIQYANTFALFCLISIIILKLQFKNYINKEKNRDNFFYNLKIALLKYLNFIFISCLLLSESRYTIAILILFYFINFIIENKNEIKNKLKNYDKKEILNFSFNIIYIILFVAMIENFMYKNKEMIYIIVLGFSIFYIGFLIFYHYYLEKKIVVCYNKIKMLNKNLVNKSKYFKYLPVCFTLVFIILFCSVIFAKTDIYLDMSSKQNYILRTYYNVNTKSGESVENTIDIKIKELEVDTRFKVEVNKLKKDGTTQNVATYYYYTNPSSRYLLKENFEDDVIGVNIKISIQKGSLNVENININGKEKAYNYLFLPNDLIDRLSQNLHRNQSENERFSFIADAFKIITLNKTNFIFGVGGEGFKNLYPTYRTYMYNSTEVHSSIVQIFLESGVLGFITFLLIMFYSLKELLKSKNRFWLLFLAVYAHLLFELDFSYMIIISIFGVMLATFKNIEIKDEF